MINNHENIKDYITDFEQLPVGIGVIKNDEFSTLTEANPAFYKIIGYTKEEFSKNHKNRMNDILIDDFFDIVQKQKTEKSYDIEWDIRMRRADGSICWIHNNSHYNADSNTFYVIFIDITDKMIATARELSFDVFQTRNEILGYLNLYTSEHITIIDAVTDEVVYVNPAASKLLGFKCESDWLGKQYCELAFGSKENAPPSYYEPLYEDRFISGEYYNELYKMYFNIKSKIITVSKLNRKMKLNIITDITAQKKLEQRMTFRTTLYNCMEALFTIGATSRDIHEGYFDIINQLKLFYHADGAFFYKFVDKTHKIEAVYKVLQNDTRSSKFDVGVTASDEQIKMLEAISRVDSIAEKKSVLNEFSDTFKTTMSQFKLNYKVNNFTCVSINNLQGDCVAFMGVTNPRYNEEDKELMRLLSRFICMFIEHEQDDMYKEQAIKLEDISKTKVVETCVQNFQDVKNAKNNINSTLDVLCDHFDADFAVTLLKQADGTFSTSYSGGEAIPDLTAFQNQGKYIMLKWSEMFGTQPKFASSTDFDAFNSPAIKNALLENFGIYNFIVAPIQDSKGDLIGLLYVNNFKFLNRSRLIVHVVEKNISDYLSKIKMYKKTQLEPATKLTNKVATQNQISRLIKEGGSGTLFIIDIDNFKNLNDTLGHGVGDQAIVEIAGILKKISRTTDVVGRVGGDEFMIFCTGLVADNSINKKAQQIIENCNLSYGKDELTVKISVSVGVCCMNESSDTFDTLYTKADFALYRAKKEGKNQYKIYNI